VHWQIVNNTDVKQAEGKNSANISRQEKDRKFARKVIPQFNIDRERFMRMKRFKESHSFESFPLDILRASFPFR